MKMVHPYIPNDTEPIRRRMLETIGVSDIDDLFSDIPTRVRFKGQLSLPSPLSEFEVTKEVEKVLGKNKTVKDLTSFLGGGVWSHFVPSVVDAVASRTEFLTSYTPYQPEINQGLLQALFEYQSLICELVDMDIANCSLYDWASSLGEAARMAMRVTGRTELLVPHFMHPNRLATLQTYTESAGMHLLNATQKMEDGQFNVEDLKAKISSNTAGVYIENPSYLGFLIDEVDEIAELAHSAGALFIVGVDPTSLGVIRPPGAYGADIVIGEGQPLGNQMSFGGPLLGIFACRNENRFLRQMPGKIVGMTTTLDGKQTGFCLTLTAREQHIRRGKATSNICTNGAAIALRTAVYLSLMGGEGMKKLGETILSLSHYAIKCLSRVRGLRVPLFQAAHFKEFVINVDATHMTVNEINHRLLEHNILGGTYLGKDYPELGQAALYCVTEMHTKDQIDSLCETLTTLVED